MANENGVKLEIWELQQSLITCQEMFQDFFSKKYKSEAREKLEALDKFKIDIEGPDVPRAKFEEKENSDVDVPNLKELMKKVIKLVQILSHKVDCPISKVIDAI